MSPASKQVRPLGDFLRVLIAPAIWFAHFSVLYAAEALTCLVKTQERGFGMGWTIALATAGALTGQIILIARLLRSGTPVRPAPDDGMAWLRRTSLLLSLLSGLAIVWTTLPAVILPPCAP